MTAAAHSALGIVAALVIWRSIAQAWVVKVATEDVIVAMVRRPFSSAAGSDRDQIKAERQN